MKKFAQITLLCTAVLSLAACGKSDSASEAATAENVEMPAEEAISNIDAAAAPVTDASAMASATPEAVSSTAASDAATAPAETTGSAVEKATADAEKKM
jgi:hypothetical protein